LEVYLPGAITRSPTINLSAGAYIAAFFSGSSSICTWIKAYTNGQITFTIVELLGVYYLRAQFQWIPTVGGTINYETTIDPEGELDCTAFDNLELPVSSVSGVFDSYPASVFLSSV
jgi:hypothetical protein